MAFTPRFKEKIVTLTALHDNLEPFLQEMPHLAKDHAAIAALLTRARELESRQDLVETELRSINRQRVELEKEGRAARSRVASVLRGTFGPASIELGKFGFQPRSQPSRSKRLTKVEQVEQLNRQAAQVRAELEAEAEAAAKAAAEAKRRADAVALSTS